MLSKKVLKNAFIWTTTLFALVILFTKIKPSMVLEVIVLADRPLLALSLAVSLGAHIIFAPIRFRAILRSFGCLIPLSEIIIFRMGSLPVKMIFPLRGEELSRVAYLRKIHRVSIPKAAGAVIAGYLLNILILTAIVVGCSAAFDRTPLKLALFFVLALCVTALPALFRSCISSERVKKALGPKWEKIRALRDITAPRTLVTLSIQSLCIELCKLLNTFLLFRALGVNIPPAEFLLRAPLTLIAAALPITLWGLGTRESSILLLFAGFASPEQLLGASLLISFVNSIFPVFVGLGFIKPFLDRFMKSKDG
ncbi:MAG: lysylphosphatidylglycerol synthase transmembrane domain-containing protein [Candidatus Omnitrophota bacterium]